MIRGNGLAVPVVAAALVLSLPATGLLAEEKARYTRTVEDLEIPDVTLVNQDGDIVEFRAKVLGDKPVFVEFIFATCTTICPILSAGFASMQRKLGPEAQEVELISITIDPEHDNPEELTKYLDRYRAQPGWDFLTGTREDIDQVMKAFDAYVPDKMSHRPLTFVRSPVDGHWVRLHGFVGTADLLAELQRSTEK